MESLDDVARVMVKATRRMIECSLERIINDINYKISNETNQDIIKGLKEGKISIENELRELKNLDYQ